MQKLLNVCQDYALSDDLLFKSKKSMCMKFVTKSHMKTFPPMTLMGSEISFVDQCKYLGTIIDVKNSDSDMKRQMKRLYASSNTIISKFPKCSYDAKIMMFKSFCTNLYCSQFWHNMMNKVRICYNNCLRRLMNIPKFCSASQMFVYLNVPSFGEILRRNIYSFVISNGFQYVELVENSVVLDTIVHHNVHGYQLCTFFKNIYLFLLIPDFNLNIVTYTL